MTFKPILHTRGRVYMCTDFVENYVRFDKHQHNICSVCMTGLSMDTLEKIKIVPSYKIGMIGFNGSISNSYIYLKQIDFIQQCMSFNNMKIISSFTLRHENASMILCFDIISLNNATLLTKSMNPFRKNFFSRLQWRSA